MVRRGTGAAGRDAGDRVGTQSADDDYYKIITAPFLRGLQETGYVERQNIVIEFRWAENQLDRLPALAADLVRRRVAVIVTSGTPAALAAKAATTTIPIVFSTGSDPIALGLVASLNRPGANATGSTVLNTELAPKRLQLLRELIPNAAVFGVLVDPENGPTQSVVADLLAAARTLALQLVIVNARTDSDLETAFATFSQRRVGAVLFGNSTFFNSRIEKLATLAARHALPAMFPFREYVLAGGLTHTCLTCHDGLRLPREAVCRDTVQRLPSCCRAGFEIAHSDQGLGRRS